MRTSTVKRKTAETDIELSLCLDGSGKNEIDSGCGFLDHMLTLFSQHGRFNLTVKCVGDTQVDDHHTVEDIGICLGMAFAEALGEMRGITRYGSSVIPMDEALVMTAVDVSGRGYLVNGLKIPTEKVGTFDTQLVEEFLIGFSRKSGITVHIQQFAGVNSHHIIEAMFKSLARSLRTAVKIDEEYANEIPSTKGVL